MRSAIRYTALLMLVGATAADAQEAYAYHLTEHLATHLREEGRLADVPGDRGGAVGAYWHYLALRSDPERATQYVRN